MAGTLALALAEADALALLDEQPARPNMLRAKAAAHSTATIFFFISFSFMYVRRNRKTCEITETIPLAAISGDNGDSRTEGGFTPRRPTGG